MTANTGLDQARESLDRLQDRLEPGQRAVLVAKLHARVPMPDGFSAG